MKTHICNAQCRQIITIMSARPLRRASTSGSVTKMRRHITRPATETRGRLHFRWWMRWRGHIFDRRHAALEGTSCREVLPGTNTTSEDFLLLFFGGTTGVGAFFSFLLGDFLPSHVRAEDDVLSERGCLEGWAGSTAFLQAIFLPGSSLGDSWVHLLTHNGRTNPSCDLGLLALIVDSERNDSLGAVFVVYDFWCRERRCGNSAGVVIQIIGPVALTRYLRKTGSEIQKLEAESCSRCNNSP